ncbi:protein-glutamate O-methyltransferase CheR [Sphingomonas bacterium]|uniref:CheR family methyltransferase n=1 Tax=Sphingomonas bacterium TaxID=1895847 RepID=UPI0026176785|nr:protein-glutamate O-methyltransferase CheR [Sphingomonas bacterium]MDB5678042.1 protein-glutamate O-methyltransferase CheR [Sphingomonas bacterium]
MLNPCPTGPIAEFAALLEARTGQQIDANRRWRIETALKPSMRDTGHESLDSMAAAIKADRTGALANRVVDELLNQESSFFRDAPVFDLIANVIAAVPATRRPRIWSAGCSTGQEPLSLAMLFAEKLDEQMPEIVATDVSASALDRAKAGRFTQFEIQRGLPIRRMMQWFDTVDGDWIANPGLTRMVSFRRMNLVADPLPIGRLVVILCRNVLLYFSLDLRRKVLERLAQVLRPEGLLVLGAGETVIGQTDAFKPSQRYRGLYEPTWPAAAAA